MFGTRAIALHVTVVRQSSYSENLVVQDQARLFRVAGLNPDADTNTFSNVLMLKDWN